MRSPPGLGAGAGLSVGEGEGGRGRLLALLPSFYVFQKREYASST